MTRQAEALKPERQVVLEFAGGIPVVLTSPSDYLAERHIEALRTIEAEADRGRKIHAARLALQLEARLGITVEERISAMRAANDADALIENLIAAAAAGAAEPPTVGRRRRAKSPFAPLAQTKAEMAGAIELPAAERGRDHHEVGRWDTARRNLLNPKSSLSEQQKEAQANIMADVEASPARRQDERDLSTHLDRREAEAKAKGHTVERSHSGRVNVVTWDAVKSLGQAKALSAEELDTAFVFKGLYEQRQSDAGAMDYGAIRGAGHDHEAFIAKRAERAFACAKIGWAEMLMRMRCGENAQCLKMFGAVVGDNIALSSFGKGRAYERNLKALRQGLSIAEESLKRKM